ncbi:MAG: hypothetical protein R6U61_09285 [Thermoplasmata archaeon]
MARDEKEVYGLALIGRLTQAEIMHGRDGKEDVIKKMISKGYDGPIHITDIAKEKKYPLSYHILFLESYMELYGPESFDMLSQKAPMMEEVMGWFDKLTKKPERIISKVEDYWEKFFDFGRVEGKTIRYNEGVITGYEVCTRTPLFCRAITHYFEGVCAVIDVEAKCEHTRCQLKNNYYSEWHIAWKK